MKAQVLFDSCNFGLTSDGGTRDRVVLHDYIDSVQLNSQSEFKLSDNYIKSVKDTFINHALATLIALEWCGSAQLLPASKIVRAVNFQMDVCEKWTIMLHQLSKTDKYVLIYVDTQIDNKLIGNLYMYFDGDTDVLDCVLAELNLKHEVLCTQE